MAKLLTRIEIDATGLGGPSAPDPERCLTQAIRILTETAGAGMRLTSLSIDVTTHALGATPVSVAVKVDKRARSIVFASCEARADGGLVFSAQALFSRAD